MATEVILMLQQGDAVNLRLLLSEEVTEIFATGLHLHLYVEEYTYRPEPHLVRYGLQTFYHDTADFMNLYIWFYCK